MVIEQSTFKYLYLGVLFFLIVFMFIGRSGFYLVASCVKDRDAINSARKLYTLALWCLIVFMLGVAIFYE